MKNRNYFTLFGKQYFFTNIFDNTVRYGFGCITKFTDKNGYLEKEDTREYYHKVCFGIYRKSNSWVN